MISHVCPRRARRRVAAAAAAGRFVAAGALVLSAACGGAVAEDAADNGSLPVLTASAFEHLRHARIFFGHQSVGQNVVDGVVVLQAQDPRLRLRVGGPDEVGGDGRDGFFAHARVGRNGDPRSKTDAFAASLGRGLGGRVDVAFHKYCYVDIDARTDVPALFAYYRDTMTRLHKDYPAVTFVHVTTPLVRVQGGPKALVKKLLNRMPEHYADNLARSRFNRLMRTEYGEREPIFDLASIEASRPGQEPVQIAFGPQTGYALLPEYTSDGSHLNTRGRSRVAAELVALLSRVVEDRALRPAAE